MAIITTDLVAAFLKCPTKCFLRAHAEGETGNTYADWVRAKSDAFRRQGIKRLLAKVAPDKCATGTAAMESGRAAQWQFAVDFVAQNENLVCSCHAVERIPCPGRHRGAEFVPVRFVFSNKVTRHDKLLLAFSAHRVESSLIGNTVSRYPAAQRTARSGGVLLPD
jgi:hypothetical protein